MPDHIPEEREVANSADIHRAYELERAFYGPMEPAQRLLTLASRLEAVEKDPDLKTSMADIDISLDSGEDIPAHIVGPLYKHLIALVPTLSKE